MHNLVLHCTVEIYDFSIYNSGYKKYYCERKDAKMKRHNEKFKKFTSARHLFMYQIINML